MVQFALAAAWLLTQWYLQRLRCLAQPGKGAEGPDRARELAGTRSPGTDVVGHWEFHLF